jgi:hypothetical protein
VGGEASATVVTPMSEIIDHQGRRLATIIRANEKLQGTRFITPDESSLQLGLMMRGAGEVIAAHGHRQQTRIIHDVQEAIVVQSGCVEVDFYSDKNVVKTITLSAGDAALLADVEVSVRIIEDARCILVKQGPYLGHDKVEVK